MKQKTGNRLIALGLLLIAAALVLTGYNLWENERAKQEAERVRKALEAEIDAQSDNAFGSEEEFLWKQYPNMPMKVISIEGKEYIGILEIPGLGVVLPVMNQWNEANLRTSPCRYSGSMYSGNLILAGHNYTSHFGNLKLLKPGDEVRFTDVTGNVFVCHVADMEILSETAVEEMKAGEWDLTLFTCTYDGRERVTVRCRYSV